MIQGSQKDTLFPNMPYLWQRHPSFSCRAFVTRLIDASGRHCQRCSDCAARPLLLPPPPPPPPHTHTHTHTRKRWV